MRLKGSTTRSGNSRFTSPALHMKTLGLRADGLRPPPKGGIRFDLAAVAR